ncbi:MAG: hypothetical protein Ct9H300mP11_17950 [Chloroflexota bacterium]|nr:MAG: hypothetical protein Ct9H300mP11_17950 [Chloroflexota bacterium]
MSANWGDNALYTVISESPRGMLSEDPQPKLGPATRTFAFPVAFFIENEIWVIRAVGIVAPRREQRVLKPATLDTFEVYRRNDRVSIYVNRSMGATTPVNFVNASIVYPLEL